MREFVFINWFSSGFRLKNWVFSSNMQEKNKKKNPIGSRASRVDAKTMFFSIVCTPETHNVVLKWVFALFLVFLSVFFLETCLWTWDRISSFCNVVFRGLLNLHPLPFQILMRCFCFSDLHDFGVNYIKNT